MGKGIKLLFFIVSLVLVACGVSNEPKKVAEHFLKASVAMDFKEAKRYATPETARMLDLIQNITAKTKVNRDKLTDVKIEMGEEIINGDHATVKYKKAGSPEEFSLDLKLIDGRWLVSATGDLKGEEDYEAGESPSAADSTSGGKE